MTLSFLLFFSMRSTKLKWIAFKSIRILLFDGTSDKRSNRFSHKILWSLQFRRNFIPIIEKLHCIQVPRHLFGGDVLPFRLLCLIGVSLFLLFCLIELYIWSLSFSSNMRNINVKILQVQSLLHVLLHGLFLVVFFTFSTICIKRSVRVDENVVVEILMQVTMCLIVLLVLHPIYVVFLLLLLLVFDLMLLLM